MKHWFISIAHAVIHVQSNISGCIPIIDAMLRLYSKADEHSTVSSHLCLECIHGQHTFKSNGKVIWQGYSPEETAAGFEVYFYSEVLAAIEPELISIHAACITIDSSTVMLAGISGAGKSSTCTAALLDAANYLSDEFSLLDSHGNIHPFPRPLQWGKQCHPAFLHAELLASKFSKFSFRFTDFKHKQRYNLFWFPPHIAEQESPLTTVIFPCYDSSTQQTNIKPLLRSQALMELSIHMHHRYAPAKCIQLLNQRLPHDTTFLHLRFSNVQQAWQSIRQSLKF